MPRKIIAFVGASGYGNVGDDMYPHVLRRYFASHELIFFNSDLPETMPDGIGLMIIGGGGVVYNNSDEPTTEESPHFRKMRYYLEWARGNRVPTGFLSCGFQFRHDIGDRHLDSLTLWKPWLDEALFASFRSPQCARMFAELTGRKDGECYPDLGYLNIPLAGLKTSIVLPPRYAVIVPAGAINPRNAHTAHQIKLLEAAGCGIVWLQMGADCDDARHFDDARQINDQWHQVRGASPEEVSAVIAGAEYVMSGRYHGAVFARTNGVPFFVPSAAPHKLMVEDWGLPPAAAMGHIELLAKHLKDLDLSHQ